MTCPHLLRASIHAIASALNVRNKELSIRGHCASLYVMSPVAVSLSTLPPDLETFILQKKNTTQHWCDAKAAFMRTPEMPATLAHAITPLTDRHDPQALTAHSLHPLRMFRNKWGLNSEWNLRAVAGWGLATMLVNMTMGLQLALRCDCTTLNPREHAKPS